MRTTVRLPDDLMKQVKRLAADTDRTLTEVIEDSLREALARVHRGQLERKRFSLPTFRGPGVVPGVDLNDTAALEDLLDSERGFR